MIWKKQNHRVVVTQGKDKFSERVVLKRLCVEKHQNVSLFLQGNLLYL